MVCIAVDLQGNLFIMTNLFLTAQWVDQKIEV